MPGQAKRVIAVVTDAFAPFHREVVEGLRPHFAAAGYGLLAVTGRDVRTDRLIAETGDLDGRFGEFGTHLDVRGAIVVCGATPPQMSDAAIAEYADRLCDGPVVSLGIVLPGVPSVTIGWADAIVQLMDHMTSLRGRSRYVFVRGFAGDPHSEMREAGFRAGLERAGIEVDERLVVSGNYSVADARNSVAQMLQQGIEFDALVAANDDMAVGAISALHEAGKRVPEDVVVSGFDDSLAAFTSEPPLTTAQLNTKALTEATANLIVHAIERDMQLPSDLEIQIDSGLIIRESTKPESLPDPTDRSTSPPEGFESDLHRWIVDRWEKHRAPAHFDVDDLSAAAARTMLTGDQSFALACRRSFRTLPVDIDPADVVWMRQAVRRLRQIYRVTFVDWLPPAGRRAMGEQLMAIDEWLYPADRLVATQRHAHRQLQERLVMRLATCSDKSTLWETLDSGLRSFGLDQAWVAIEDGDSSGNEEDGPWMRLVFSLGDQSLPTPERFLRSNVLPERFSTELEQDVHVLVPLRAGDSDIGYMVLEPRGEYLLELEAIASGVAQVLRHVEQVGDLEHQASRLRLANEALDHLARRDSLTGLANRKLFLERLEQQIDSVDSDEEVTILFFDLDGFKLINDTLGHEAGDHLLRIVSNRVNDVLDTEDTLARLGGDEFIIILRHDKGSDRPVEIARATLEAIGQTCLISGRKTNVTASLGIAHYPSDGVTTDELIRNADAAMYAAKASGKSNYAHYADGLAMENESEVELREALRVGLANDEFGLEFQPRMCLKTGRVKAFEALLRWNPSGDVSEADRLPERFVVVAERNGLISAIDAFSLDRACRQARVWADAGHPMPVSVNMSVKRLQEADIAAQVVDALERYDLPPELLELELSEHALMSDLEASVSKLQSVGEIGVRCSIDDYGTAGSSIADLASLPLHRLKIDESLIAGLDDNDAEFDANRRNVRAIVALSKSLGLTPVAEGVEREGQRRFLREIGCDEAQGFILNMGMASASPTALAAWPQVVINPNRSDPKTIDGAREELPEVAAHG